MNDYKKIANGYKVMIEDPPMGTDHGPATPPASSDQLAVPNPTQPGTSENCNKYHMVKYGDDYETIAQDEHIPLDGFHKLNKGVSNDYRMLWLGYYVCVDV
ncbi:LysM domain-containing protein [Cladobotryum mycophilum]|uniref:LysM domain-containing protein n=1 Tax=Cladobotryum mycophilum TaxID=491253 RepID=A0ABR0SA53_9HYPO